MTIRRFLQWAAFIIVAIVVSIPLALTSEGIAFQYGFLNGTPGMVVANRLVPSSSDRGFEALAKAGHIMLAVDAPLWFVAICGAAVIVVVGRRRANQSNGR